MTWNHHESLKARLRSVAVAIRGLGLILLATAPGCGAGAGAMPDLVWGIHGTKDGWLHKPRVAAFDADDQLYIADLTDRIQVFDRDGDVPPQLADARLQRRRAERPDDRPRRAGCWSPTPISTGCWSIVRWASCCSRSATACRGRTPRPVRLPDRRGDRQGRATSTSPSTARTTASRSSRPTGSGCASGEGTATSRASSSGPGRWRSTTHDRIYVADSCNHRIQVFDTEGKLLRTLGRPRDEAGRDGLPLRSRARARTATSTSASTATAGSRSSTRRRAAGLWGEPGAGPGELYNPWALAVDQHGRRSR